MRVDTNIVNAIQQFLFENKVSAKDFSRELGVSEACMCKWRKVGRGIVQRRWEKLFPYIKKYLPKDRIYIDDAGNEQYASALSGTERKDFFQPRYVPMMVPVLTTEQVSYFNPMIQSVEQYFCECGSIKRAEYRGKAKGYHGIFAMDCKFKGSPIPVGATMFISSETKPNNGNFVLACDMNNRVGVYLYKVESGAIELHGCGRAIKVLARDLVREIRFMFPVVQYEIVLV